MVNHFFLRPTMFSDKTQEFAEILDHFIRVAPIYRWESDSRGAFIEIELPGVAKGDVALKIDDHYLILRAKKIKASLSNPQGDTDSDENSETESENIDQEEDGPKVMYFLRLKFSRPVDLDNIPPASFKDGLLLLKIPFRTEDHLRQIPIS